MCLESLFGGGDKGPSAEEQRKQAEAEAQLKANAKAAAMKRSKSLLTASTEQTAMPGGQKTTTGA